MIIEKDKVIFTDSDKENVIINKYTDEELKANEQVYIKKSNKRRIIFLIILAVTIILSFVIPTIKYPLHIAIAFMIFLIIVYECGNRYDRKAARRKYYIEIIIEEKLERETSVDSTLSPGNTTNCYYPIRGRVTGNNYESIFYVTEDQYNSQIGDTIRMSLGVEKL